ncbi:MAG: cation transporter [Ignavibacteria bacterium]|nr:cation transporter [Ignavibacteria bacterium]
MHENQHTLQFTEKTRAYLQFALYLSIFTIFYNLAEGIVSVWLGFSDESLSLFGFGLDSFVEMFSGIGIAHMVFRMKFGEASRRDVFENTALRVTGIGFYVLASGLTVTAIYNVYIGHKPVTTLWGIIIALISIIVMLALVWGKNKCGKALNSAPIMADSRCTLVCIYMSITLLVASFLYELTHFPYFDAAGTLLIAWFSFKEGRECFEKIAHNTFCGCNHHSE